MNGRADTFLSLLLQPEELTSSLHSFKNKAFKKARVCGVCKQLIEGQGISCRGEYAFIVPMLIKLKQENKQTKNQNETFFQEFPKVKSRNSPSQPEFPPTLTGPGLTIFTQICTHEKFFQQEQS